MVNRRTNVPGVMFGDHHSYRDYGLWFRERPDVGDPGAKVNLVDIPGADGSLDITEAVTGEVKYYDRTLVFKFAAKANTAEQQDLKRRLRNELHGKRMNIILDEDSDYYYDGRLSVVFENVMPWKMWVTITAVCDPYKYSLEETSVIKMLSASGTSVEIEPTENVSRQRYNSLFVFGSPSAPTGDLGIFDTITVEWGSTQDVYASSPKFVIDDADGGHLEIPVTTPLDRTSFPVTVSALASQNINTEKVYQIALTGIGSARIFFAGNAVEFEVENGRKTVVPSVQIQSSYSITVKVWLNNAYFEFENGISTNPRMVLTEGINKVIMKPVGGGGFATLRFRRGWL